MQNTDGDPKDYVLKVYLKGEAIMYVNGEKYVS